MYTLRFFFSKNNRKHLAIAVKYMEGSKNRISFIKDVEITDGKFDTIYLALSNKITKCGAI